MSATPESDPASSPRFSWPVRILIFFVLFHMLFRSTDVLYPWNDWLRALKLERMPRPLPTRAELDEMREKADGSLVPVYTEFGECLASLFRYWNPCPKEETVAILDAEHIHWGGARFNKLDRKTHCDCKLPGGVGLMVMEVAEASPAEAAGLQVDDVLAKIDGRNVPEDIDRLTSVLDALTPDAGVTLVVMRKGQELALSKSTMPALASSSRLDNAWLWIKYALAWTASRLQWCESILNIDQEWPMFSPNVGTRKYPARARLLYADGTETTVRQRSDPEDLTWYIRWGPGKNLAYDRFVSDYHGNRHYACPGWCRILAQEHPVNANGSPLQEIRLYQVRYDFPAPDQDAHQVFVDTMERTRDHRTISEQVYTTFFRYWPTDDEKGRGEHWEFVKAYKTRYGLTDLEMSP